MTDREKLLELFEYEGCIAETCDDCHFKEDADGCYRVLKEYLADHLIANGVTVQKRGEWINERMLVGGFREIWGVDCSECGWTEKDRMPNYCPNCGAYMKGKEE